MGGRWKMKTERLEDQPRGEVFTDPVAPPLCPCCGLPMKGPPLRLIEGRRALVVGGEIRILAPALWTLLELLRERPGCCALKERVFTRLFGDRLEPPGEKILDIYVYKLRHALEGSGWRIETVWGQGWTLQPQSAAAAEALRPASRYPFRRRVREEDLVDWRDDGSEDARPAIPRTLKSDAEIKAAFGKGSFG